MTARRHTGCLRPQSARALLLGKTVADACLMLEQEHGAKLGEADRVVVERTQNALPVFNRECYDWRLQL